MMDVVFFICINSPLGSQRLSREGPYTKVINLLGSEPKQTKTDQTLSSR